MTDKLLTTEELTGIRERQPSHSGMLVAEAIAKLCDLDAHDGHDTSLLRAKLQALFDSRLTLIDDRAALLSHVDAQAAEKGE